MKRFVVITTVNPKTKAVSLFEKMKGWHVVVVGDKKSKRIESSANLTFLSVEDQYDLGYESVPYFPFNHYARKNIGYLSAIQQGADIIYDTDDDNLPYEHWGFEEFFCQNCILDESKYFNIYRYFKDKHIWPRGYPLDKINSTSSSYDIINTKSHKIGVWQGLVDEDADVDAIYRMIYNKSIKFDKKDSVFLPRGKYCPFNSQNTLWSEKAFPLLYLPATVSFRFTDILRGYLAQRCMWEEDLYLGYCSPTVYQNRNKHDLMNDFKDEIECFLNTRPIIELIDSIKLDCDLTNSLLKLYTELASAGYVDDKEVSIVGYWLNDFERFKRI